MKRPSDALNNIPPAVFIATKQAGDEELQKADNVVAREGTVNEVRSNTLDKTILSPIADDHEIETEIAMRRDQETELGEQDNKLSSLDVNLIDTEQD